MRRVIFSRKGFDSENGGMPSAFLPGREMVSFPIPDTWSSSEMIRYDDISAEGMSLRKRIDMLREGNGRKRFMHESCHHDPDLIRDSRVRPSLDGWRGIFGQSGGMQTHLCKNSVRKGDLFLFFGWFREAENGPEGLRFRPGAPDLHAFFGYLQIGEILRVTEDAKFLECFSDHPHLTPDGRRHTRRGKKRKENNAVYIGADSFSLDSDLPGYGVFRHSPELVLTAKGRTRAYWSLPDFFRNRPITHLRKDAWEDPDGCFRSADIGQEFVVSDDENETVTKWAADLIRRHYLRS